MSVVDGSESLGFVKRVQGRNRRSKALILTDGGTRAYERALDFERAIMKDVMSFASNPDLEAFGTTLGLIRDKCEQGSSNDKS